MALVEILEILKSAVGLGKEVANLFDAQSDTPDIYSALAELRDSAVTTARELAEEVIATRQELIALGVNFEASEARACSEFRGSVNFIQKFRFNQQIRKVEALRSRLRQFADDVEDLFICAKQTRRIEETVWDARHIRQRLYEFSAQDATLAESFSYMQQASQEILNQIQERR